MAKSSKKSAPEPTSRASTLVNRLKPKQTPVQATAEMVVAGLASNAIATREWSAFPFGEIDVTACLHAVVTSAERLNRGDLGAAEALLLAQATTLNAVFTQLAHRAQINVGEYLDVADRYMRLALKAQSQCRATIETLAVIKNPPTVFARQANIAHGPQQVNNGVSPTNREIQSPSRAGNREIEPIELLEAHDARMDAGTPGEAVGGDPALAAVAAVDRPKNRRR